MPPQQPAPSYSQLQPSQQREELKRELSAALNRLPGLQGVVPGGDAMVRKHGVPYGSA